MSQTTVRVKALAKRALGAAGIQVRRLPKAEIRDAARRAGMPCELVSPIATYAPWRADRQFGAAFEAVRDYTLVDEYRLYELWSLVRQTTHLPGDIIEVGVWRGGSGALIAKSAILSGSGSRVFLCDTFTGVVKASARDSTYRGGEWADTSRTAVERLMRSMELDNVRILEGVLPEESAGGLSDATVRLCHIDVDVYESARGVLHWVWDRLVRGAVVVFDDYGFPKCDGVRRLVEEEMGASDRLVVHNLNGHAVMVRTG
jgi:O-methyltransferase